jgi:putative membrane protein
VAWSRARVASFCAGVLLVLTAVVGPLHDLQFDLLAAHLLQKVVLAEWAPALLVFGLPPELGRRLACFAPVWLALPVWLVTYYVWHLPPVYDAALENPNTLLQLEHVSYLVAGTALWLPLAHGSIGNGAKSAYVFAVFVLVSPVGLLLLFLPRAAYDFYDGHWGLTALEDQQLAGVTMVSEAGVVFFAVLAFYFARFAREES